LTANTGATYAMLANITRGNSQPPSNVLEVEQHTENNSNDEESKEKEQPATIVQTTLLPLEFGGFAPE
jgi:hypothetical protein